MNLIKNILKFLWKKKWLALILVVVGFVLIRFFGPKSDDNVELTEYTVEKGTVSKLVTATGQVTATNLQELSFGVQGKISELKVEEGVEVKKGDYLASIDTTSLQAQIKIAKGALQSASANYNNTKQSLDKNIQDMTNEVVGLDKKIAESTFEATKKLNNNTVDKAKLSLKIAGEGIDASEEALDNLEEEKDLSKEVSDANIDLGSVSGDEAENLAESQKDLSQFQYEGRIEGSESELDILEYQKEQQELDYDSSKINSENVNTVNELGLEKAEKQVELGDLRSQQIDIAKQNNLNSLGGQIMNAQGSLEIAQYNLNQAKLYAPFDGTVLDVPYKVGDYYAGPQASKAILVGDLSGYKVETEINELDILTIKVGQKAKVEFEAEPGRELDGKVSKINPAPQLDSSGVVNYLVEIEIVPDNLAIYHGLSANVEIIVEEKTEIINIPFVAVSRKEDGQYVQVKDQKGLLVERKIETGLQSINNVEVTSGLVEGDVIVY